MTSPPGADRDLLVRAARAFRDEADRSHADVVEAWQGMHGWQEVSRAVRTSARRRRLGLVVAVQLVAAVVGIGAWAAVSGRLPALFSRKPVVSEAREHGQTKRPGARRRSAGASAATATADEGQQPARASADEAAPAPSFVGQATAVIVVAPDKPRPALGKSAGPRSVARDTRSNATSRGTPEPAPTPSSPAAASDEIYRRAHHEHFVRRDYLAALALWDQYLASGEASLAWEARFNRAIALIHLQRAEEAKVALRPFADGTTEGYRQREAAELLRMLRARSSPAP